MQSFLWPKPMSPADLRRLEKHTYSASGVSVSEPLCEVYLTWLFGIVPVWMAPCVLTVAGLMVNVVYTAVLVCYCPTATEEAPSWAFIMSAVGLLAYQCMDTFDGKQCRKMGHDTPVEEIFDHGCDAVSTAFIATATCIACGMGQQPNWAFVCGFIGMFMFFCSHWQAYVSGTIHFGVIDWAEAQMSIIIVFMVSAFAGVNFWHTTLPVIGVKPFVFPVIGIIGGAIYSCCNYSRLIWNGGGKNICPDADISVLSPGLPIGLTLTMAFIIFKRSSSHLFEEYLCLYLITFGMVISKFTIRLLVAHMCKSTFPLADTAFIGPALLFLNQYFNSFIDEHIVLWIVMVFSALDLARYFIGAALQISSHLNLYIFSHKWADHVDSNASHAHDD